MTKICVTASGPLLDSMVDFRFGRCAYFIFVDPETMQFDAISNEAARASGGAGILAAQKVMDLGADTVITGSVGPNAYPALENAGIRILSCNSGSVRTVIEEFKQGTLIQLAGANPVYMGMGGRRGMGLGRGRGGRRGQRRNW